MQELREMHTEKINVMGRFLEVFEKSFKKGLELISEFSKTAY